MFILTIDDDPDDSFIFVEALHEIDPDIQCECVTKPQDAIQLLSDGMQVVPDFIFLDVNMPCMGGEECLKAIRKIEKLKEVPVIMLSTFISEKDERNYKHLNAACLKKTGDFNALKTALKTVIRC
ncbi:MAG TPA: response regulator [Chryseosolibacter sp.]|nr:response regulator [Chryseosolibacter sp.]